METKDSQQQPPPPPSPSEEGMEADEDEDGGLPLGDDPVVREIPVYLSTELAQQLHVIQYPNRPFYRPYGTPAAARVKPANKLLELEYALPLSSEHLDEEAPRHLRLERIKVQSSYLDAMTTYAVGTMCGEALHLTPLAGIYQMRASCEHVDAASEDGGEGGLLPEDEDSEAEDGPMAGSSSRAKAGAAAASSAAAGGGGAAAPPVKLQHIEYKKRESEKAAAARRTSYAYKRQQEEAEVWTELGIHPQGSEASAQDWARLRCPEESTGRPIQFKGGSGVYVDLYRRETARARGGEEKGAWVGLAEGTGEVMVVDDDKAAVLSSLGGQQDGAAAPPEQRPAIQQLSGAEQVAAIFERASVVSFDMVLALANPNPFATPGSLVTLLELMKKHAMLVRGNWVRKSGLCGLPPRLAAARDALLLLLERYGGVNRMQLARAAGLADEEVLALLEPLARLDADRRMWVAACPDDAEFCRRHPEVAAQQARAWRERERDRDVAAVLQVVGVPDCPFPGPLPGMELLMMEAGGGGKSAGAGVAKAAGSKGRRK